MKSLKIKNQNGNVKSKILSFSSVIFHFDISILHLKGLSFFILIFAFYILTLPKQASAAVSNLGLVGYWSFNEGTGSYAGDSSGNRNQGTLTNGPTWVDGKRGKALNFDGVNDYVIASSTSLNNLPAMTVSAWMFPRSSGEGTVGNIVTKSQGAGVNGWRIYQDGTQIRMIVDYDGGSDLSRLGGTGSETLNQWQHIVFTWDGSSISTNIKIYRDGKEVSGTSGNNGTGNRISDSSNSLIIGNDDGQTRTFNGLIDDVRVYNRALSAAEIQTLYKSGAQKFTAPPTNLGLVGYWSMNENTGTIAGDASGNNNRGILTNGPTWVDGKRGKALNFDGVDDYVNAGSAGNFERTNSFTVSLWIKRNPNPTVTEAVVAKEVGSGTFQGWGLLILGGAANDPYRINIANTSGTNNLLVEYPRTNDSGWHHVVFTYNGTSAAS